jgi:uncharacterized protein YPO0396
MKDLLKNRVVQLGLAVLIGAAIGALFYPTKRIEERVKQEYQERVETERTEKETLRKQLTEEINELREEKTTLTVETTKTIAKLTYEVRELQSKKKETFYKIVRPDGTIEIRKFKESEVNETTQVITSVREEFDQKIVEIEDRWKRVHTKRVEDLKKDFDSKEKTYKEVIAKLESEKITDINPKKYGLEVGYLSSQQYYFHGNVDVFGPVFIGVHTQTNFGNEHAVGAGIGLRF